MSLASYWLRRAELKLIVNTKCRRCGCVHPRSLALLRQRPSVAGMGKQFILPCVKCTERGAAKNGIAHTRQTIVEAIRP